MSSTRERQGALGLALFVLALAACAEGHPPPAPAAATPAQSPAASTLTAPASEAIASLKGYHDRLSVSAERAMQYCGAGSRGSCLHAEALKESLSRLSGAMQALNAGRSVATVTAEYNKIFMDNAKVLDGLGFTVRLHGDCWYEGGNPCMRVHDAAPSQGMKAVGSSWGAYLVERVLTRDTKGMNLPR